MKKPVVFLFAVLFISVSGCGLKNEVDKSRAVATVNGERITLNDVQREFEHRYKQDPDFKLTSALFAERLETMIDRRLLIQEAMKRRLAEDERFVSAIKKFWEQTLIQRLMVQLTREFGQVVKVNEDDVTAFYARLSEQATFRVVKTDDRAEAERLVLEAKAGTAEWGTVLGPLTYDRATSPVLEKAFILAPGDAAAYEADGGYVVVRVESKTPAIPPPLEKIRGQIANQIVRRKQQESLEKWLEFKRASAKIEIKDSSDVR